MSKFSKTHLGGLGLPQTGAARLGNWPGRTEVRQCHRLPRLSQQSDQNQQLRYPCFPEPSKGGVHQNKGVLTLPGLTDTGHPPTQSILPHSASLLSQVRTDPGTPRQGLLSKAANLPSSQGAFPLSPCDGQECQIRTLTLKLSPDLGGGNMMAPGFADHTWHLLSLLEHQIRFP